MALIPSRGLNYPKDSCDPPEFYKYFCLAYSADIVVNFPLFDNYPFVGFCATDCNTLILAPRIPVPMLHSCGSYSTTQR